MREADLYLPVKRFLEWQQYEVKSEIHGCDVIGVRGGEDPVVVELKLALNLTVILQAVDRLALTPTVYVGVPGRCRTLHTRRRQIFKLLRMLGLGLLRVDPGSSPQNVEVLLDPGDYRPRTSKGRHERLLGEFTRRVGDPNLGGAETRRGLMTAYRQATLAVARFLEQRGPAKAADVARAVSASNAGTILHRDVYGWFERISRGVYRLSPRGRNEIPLWGNQARGDEPYAAPDDRLGT